MADSTQALIQQLIGIMKDRVTGSIRDGDVSADWSDWIETCAVLKAHLQKQIDTARIESPVQRGSTETLRPKEEVDMALKALIERVGNNVG